ncbi:hypothetical protein CASFOL_013225 [Castilleja foliolosa]|uniref:F-box associated beta-propeller type 1 domain-containing protein n=1 Tax=Castilleja foliolosa TaxID=1961234 RepID=A0ABD3DJE5_9LAMI
MGDDFKVVMIVAVASTENITSVEIYSANLDSWITIDVGFQFSLFCSKNDLIVNGNPYWGAWVGDVRILVCFDVLELVLKIVPTPTTYGPDLLGLGQETNTKIWTDIERDVDVMDMCGSTWTRTEVSTTSRDTVKGAPTWQFDYILYFEITRSISILDRSINWIVSVELVDWNGALASLVIDYKVKYCVDTTSADESSECSARIVCVRVWVFDDIQRIWRNDHTCGPIEVDVYRGIYCSKNGKVMGILSSGTLFLLDLETGFVKELFDEACFGSSFEVYAYTESLAYINGMEKVVVKYEPNDLDD